MANNALSKLSKELGRISIPSYIYTFLSEKGKEITNFKDAYMKLINWMPSNEPTPTLNEAMLFYNLARLQQIADAQIKGIDANEDKLRELLKNPEIKKNEIQWYQKNIERLENRYHQLAKDLLKYSDSGTNRESQVNEGVSLNKVTIQQLNLLINKSSDYLDVEAKKVN